MVSTTDTQHLATPRTQARTASVLCRGILDSYRREQAAAAGVPVADEPATSSGSSFDSFRARVAAEGDDGCPAECVREIFTAQELKDACEAAGEALVVVDFYKTACGACKYIQPGFVKLCKATHEDNGHPEVLFLKHNVYDDEEEELTDLARRLQIRTVPQFYFYRAMELLEKFPTRNRKRVAEAINKYTNDDTVHVEPGCSGDVAAA